MTKKSKFLIVFFVILLIAGVLLLWNSLIQRLYPKTQTGQEQEEIFVNGNTPISERTSFKTISEPERIFPEEIGLNVPVFSTHKSKAESAALENKTYESKYTAFFENIQKATQFAQDTVERKVSTPTAINPGVLSSTFSATSTKEIRLTLTNEEFNYLYPASFLENLNDGQDLLKEYDPSYEPIPRIKTDTHVRYVQEKIVLALLSANMINKDEAQRYITTIRFTLPQIQMFELGVRKQTQENWSLAKKVSGFFEKTFSKTQQEPTGIFIAGLVEQLQEALAPKAYAGGGPCGECHILPVCVQEGAATPLPGIETWTAFCQCTGCLYGQGCLDKCFPAAAIWDPGTGICGCGL